MFTVGKKLDMVVVGAGTGGSVTGLGRKLKQKFPDCKVVALDPEGSILAEPEELNVTDTNFYEVEGIGYDFIPTVLDRKIVDRWYKSSDKEALLMARRLIREEGLLCGGSSGSALVTAIQACKDFKLNSSHRCVVVFPDSVRNYMTKFLSDDWMAERSFIQLADSVEETKAWWWNLPVRQLNCSAPVTVHPSVTVQEALVLMHREGFDQIPVTDESGVVAGMVTMPQLMSQVNKAKVKPSDPVEKVLFRQYKKVTLDTPLRELSRMMETDHFALVVHEQRQYTTVSSETRLEIIVGILTSIDLLNFIMEKEGISGSSM